MVKEVTTVYYLFKQGVHELVGRATYSEKFIDDSYLQRNFGINVLHYPNLTCLYILLH